jgi:hypothetical protein
VAVSAVRRGFGTVLTVLTVVAMIGGGAVVAVWWLTHQTRHILVPECRVRATTAADAYTLSPDQMDNAATIAAVGLKLGMPDHAVTIALATALQESKLINLSSGDRDSAGLFQQRPSQGWGNYAQVTDPVYASTAFYKRLEQQGGWQSLTVTEAAQLVQRSAAPEAYADWESEARTLAGALTGELPAALACSDLTIGGPSVDLSAAALSEWGSNQISGTHETARSWALGAWLVAHAQKLGVDQVTVNGQTWTAASGSWSAVAAGAASGVGFHRITVAPTSTPS